MTLTLRLAVKFRVAGITFGQLHREFRLAIPLRPARLLQFSERGVSLTVDTE